MTLKVDFLYLIGNSIKTFKRILINITKLSLNYCRTKIAIDWKMIFKAGLHGHETDKRDRLKCPRDESFETNLSI